MMDSRSLHYNERRHPWDKMNRYDSMLESENSYGGKWHREEIWGAMRGLPFSVVTSRSSLDLRDICEGRALETQYMTNAKALRQGHTYNLGK
jgi:hypothetical protein